MQEVKYLDFDLINKPYREELLETFEEFLDNGYYVLGSGVQAFENKFAKFCGVKHCIGVASGLDALILSLKVLNIGDGDEVIVPSNTYIATVIAINHVGATPIFVEPNLNDYNIDPGKLESSISAKTRAIIPVHLYGRACEMNRIMKIADSHQIFVIEDNAQAHGAEFEGKRTGSFGKVNATSFYPSKNLGALGDGGAITTDDDDLANRLRILRNYGTSKKYVTEEIGYNSRLDELHARMLSVKMNHLDFQTSQRIDICEKYNDGLHNISELILPVFEGDGKEVGHLYVIRTKCRDDLRNFLTKCGIGSIVHYPVPPHLQKAYEYLNGKPGDYPIAEQMANEVLSLPCYPNMPESDVDYVIECITTFFSSKE